MGPLIVSTVSDVTFPGGHNGHLSQVKQRIEWIDLVKATSVLLVVFMHASNTLVDIGGRSAVTGALQHEWLALEALSAKPWPV